MLNFVYIFLNVKSCREHSTNTSQTDITIIGLILDKHYIASYEYGMGKVHHVWKSWLKQKLIYLDSRPMCLPKQFHLHQYLSLGLIDNKDMDRPRLC